MTLSAAALERRSHGLGSSDAAVALGLVPQKSPFRLWQEKRREIEPEDLSGNEAVELGILLEPVVSTLFERRTGLKLRRHNATIEHPTLPFMVCNIDRDVVGLPKLAEIKTAGYWAAQSDEWGEAGTSAVPFKYGVQVQHQLSCLPKYESGYVPLLVAGQNFRLYEVQRDEEIIGMLEAFLAKFWDGVLNNVPPAPINLAQAQERWPKSVGRSILATDEIVKTIGDLQSATADRLAAEKIEKRLKGEIAIFMEDADSLMSPDGSTTLLTYKLQERAGYVADATSFRMMRLK
jgi:putative phage-type endonuclease